MVVLGIHLCHSVWRLRCLGFLSLLNAWKRSIPRNALSKFIPTIPTRASGSSTPFPKLGASRMSLAVMRTWDVNLAKMKVNQLRTHSTFTITLLASRTPAIRRTFLTCRKMEWSWDIEANIILVLSLHTKFLLKSKNANAYQLSRALKYNSKLRKFYLYIFCLNS